MGRYSVRSSTAPTSAVPAKASGRQIKKGTPWLCISATVR